MIKILEGGDSGSIVDQALEDFGQHSKTFLYFNTCREMNKRPEYQKEINQCFDYIFQKRIPHQEEWGIEVKRGSMKVEPFESHEH